MGRKTCQSFGISNTGDDPRRWGEQIMASNFIVTDWRKLKFYFSNGIFCPRWEYTAWQFTNTWERMGMPADEWSRKIFMTNASSGLTNSYIGEGSKSRVGFPMALAELTSTSWPFLSLSILDIMTQFQKRRYGSACRVGSWYICLPRSPLGWRGGNVTSGEDTASSNSKYRQGFFPPLANRSQAFNVLNIVG